MAPRWAAMQRVGCRAAVLLCVAFASTAHAEMSDEAYRSAAGAVPPAQRSRVEAELAAARASEAAAAALREAQDDLRARELAQQRARRPVAEQLLEARCSGCHAAALVDSARYGSIGWRWTVERMRWWHGAPITASEASSIARHLAVVRPAATLRIWTERAIVAALALSALSMPGWWWWQRRRRRSHARR